MQSNTNNHIIKQSIYGSIKGVLFIMASILLFAFIINITNLSSSYIKPINQVIKVLAIFTACLFSIKDSKAYIKGGAIGLLTTVLTSIIFMIISSQGITLTIILDVIFGTLIGMISGIITINLKK